MATTGTHRSSTVFLALIVGIALGWLVAIYKPGSAPGAVSTETPAPRTTEKPVIPATTPTCVPRASYSGNHNVIVGPTANDVHPECVTIGPDDTITWRSLADNIPLAIEFDQKVFANMTQVKSGGWRVNSSATSSSSGKVIATGEPGSSTTYVYTQTLGNEIKDGRIIIVRP